MFRFIYILIILNLLPSVSETVLILARKYSLSSSTIILKGSISGKTVKSSKLLELEGVIANQSGIRPIFVYEIPFAEETDYIGFAIPLPLMCIVVLDKKYIKEVELETVKNLLTHEILHCHFYNHETEPESILHPTLQQGMDYNKSIGRYYKNIKEGNLTI